MYSSVAPFQSSNFPSSAGIFILRATRTLRTGFSGFGQRSARSSDVAPATAASESPQTYVT